MEQAYPQAAFLPTYLPLKPKARVPHGYLLGSPVLDTAASAPGLKRIFPGLTVLMRRDFQPARAARQGHLRPP